MPLITAAAIGVARTVTAHRREQREIRRMVGQTERTFATELAEVGGTHVSATSLHEYRHGVAARRVWSIQFTDESGDFAGETVWSASTAELLAASWHRHFGGAKPAQPITRGEAVEIARLKVASLHPLSSRRDWRLVRKPGQTGTLHTVWCETAGRRFRVQIDSLGRLVTLQRLPHHHVALLEQTPTLHRHRQQAS